MTHQHKTRLTPAQDAAWREAVRRSGMSPSQAMRVAMGLLVRQQGLGWPADPQVGGFRPKPLLDA
jgi:hypothetical protein